MWDSKDLVVNRCVLQMILVVCWFELQVRWLSINWFEIQLIWLSINLRFNWFGCQLIWDSNDLVVNRCVLQTILVVNWFEIQLIWLSTDVWLKWFCQTKLFCETSFKMKLWNSKTKLFCETSFKNEVLKIKNEAFLRDFLQDWSFEAQKRSFSARLPSKMKLWSSKTKLLCETSFKIEALKLKNEAFLRDFLQNWHVEQTLDLRIPIRFSDFQVDASKVYCACHEKVEPRHTKPCNCHAKWSLQSNTSVTWNLQPFHGFCVECFKHRHHKQQNPCACHAKRIVSDPLQIHHACQRFCNPHEHLRLPRILQAVEFPAPATRNTLSTSKNVPSTWRFNDFEFQIALARRRGANFAKLNFQKCSEPLSF